MHELCHLAMMRSQTLHSSLLNATTKWHETRNVIAAILASKSLKHHACILLYIYIAKGCISSMKPSLLSYFVAWTSCLTDWFGKQRSYYKLCACILLLCSKYEALHIMIFLSDRTWLHRQFAWLVNTESCCCCTDISCSLAMTLLFWQWRLISWLVHRLAVSYNFRFPWDWWSLWLHITMFCMWIWRLAYPYLQ